MIKFKFLDQKLGGHGISNPISVGPEHHGQIVQFCKIVSNVTNVTNVTNVINVINVTNVANVSNVFEN